MRIAAAGLDFNMAEGETIWTESSYKFEPEQVKTTLQECGFQVKDCWMDEEGAFILSLADAV
jgi:uncharacterized SAM-dependent methyltransferase